jgi:mono/diheme cytochrome c family protein
MTRIATSLLIAMAIAPPSGASAREAGTKPPPAYSPPPETARFITAPGVEMAQRHCLACHSADYISTQPPHMPAAFWQNEVTKMRNAYGARLTDDDVKAVTDYLVATYTEPSAGRR